MKHLTVIAILITSHLSFGQTDVHQEKFRHLEPDLWLGIWDSKHSGKSLSIDTLSYDEIPKSIDFRGTVVEALKWEDNDGENILILTVTGHFNWKEYYNDSTQYMNQDKSELYAYLFQRKPSEKAFKRRWKVYDYTECFGVDWYTGFIPKATTITDMDQDGLAEIALPYVSICRGGMDPGTMKIIMYEGSEKYALRGSTMLMCKGDHPYGGKYDPSDNLKDHELFLEFLTKHWDRNKCEDGKYY